MSQKEIKDEQKLLFPLIIHCPGIVVSIFIFAALKAATFFIPLY